ncbi:hypothetical protein MNBD_IGNAVI01-551 [hydrothermal vent metagenome]|uniref:ABC transporter domain-containing protein n=1 Tax=hydrothermal vent metagenome TaxID=652676 RepID=A0A3B1CAW3_9ZZZZ
MLKLDDINYSAHSDSLITKDETKQILFEISLEVNGGEIVGIVGESGSGKTTLAKILSGILKPDSGKIIYRRKVTENISTELSIQILFQNSIELINPFRKVEDVLAEVIKKYSSENTNDKIEKMLKMVGLPRSILSKFGSNLSGGERQRIALLRLLAADPSLLIIDEPFSAQDIESQLNLMKLLKRINEVSNVTIICVSHDLQIISKFTDKLVVLKSGRIIEEGPTTQVMTYPQHDYTKFMINSMNYNLSYDDFNM